MNVGVLRDRDGLVEAAQALLPLACCNGPESDPALVALMITIAALRRAESRGAHFRTDFPHAHAAAPHRARLGLQQALRAAQEIERNPSTGDCRLLNAQVQGRTP